ncbi:light-harvesting protein [Chloroflexus sp. Y-396-1]|uniref:light-harvesting protein n=1 Tax=Chloroflexus sp. Y-396-1 TaxID=867845 RepID=UPI00049179E1|nr:light-harvesting protein [Chloroflexus sp. Y-396-1]
MQPRSPVRTNIVIFTILGFVVALLIHFIVLSSPEYNWLSNADGGALLLSTVRTLFGI